MVPQNIGIWPPEILNVQTSRNEFNLNHQGGFSFWRLQPKTTAQSFPRCFPLGKQLLINNKQTFRFSLRVNLPSEELLLSPGGLSGNTLTYLDECTLPGCSRPLEQTTEPLGAGLMPASTSKHTCVLNNTISVFLFSSPESTAVKKNMQIFSTPSMGEFCRRGVVLCVTHWVCFGTTCVILPPHL